MADVIYYVDLPFTAAATAARTSRRRGWNPSGLRFEAHCGFEPDNARSPKSAKTRNGQSSGEAESLS